VRTAFLILFIIVAGKANAQKNAEWFPGGDEGFYRYLADRLMAMESASPQVSNVGSAVIFEFYVTDSGYVDSVKIGQCFNTQLCYSLRMILNTMPRVKAEIVNDKPKSTRRLYAVSIKRFDDGYQVEPSPFSDAPAVALPSKLKWGIAVVAVIAFLIIAIK
jgi:hypothetical protein